MADNRKPHRVNIGGLEHTMLLTERAAAEMFGDLAQPVDTKQKPAAEEKAAPAPRNKARTAPNKSK